MMALEVEDDGLRWDDRTASRGEVLGFHERFDPWTATVRLEVDGPGWSVPVDATYPPVRRALRQAFPDRPFTADWSEQGVFPGLVLDRPPALAWGLLVAFVLGSVWAFAAGFGPSIGLLLAIVWWWPLGRARASVIVDPLGVRVGPVWAPRIPWHEVVEIGEEPVGTRGTRLVVWTGEGTQEAVVPRALMPALSARMWRLGGVRVGGLPRRVELGYRRAAQGARGAPWGVLAVTLVLAAFATEPFPILVWGLLATGIAGFVGAAVEARVRGWAHGGIVWMTAAWSVVLLGILIALVG